jgi:sepiapterin reductase
LLYSSALQDNAPVTNAYLINNAGTTGDLSKKVSNYNSNEIKNYFDVNIVSFASLVSGFINLFREPQVSDESPFPPDLTIVNISSLLAVQEFPNWGLYASGKAARDMYLKVVAAEEKNNHIKTLSYAPGPLDNEMQSQVRNTLGDPEQKKIYTSMAEQVCVESKKLALSLTIPKLISCN